jgi:hypothetical protein
MLDLNSAYLALATHRLSYLQPSILDLPEEAIS